MNVSDYLNLLEDRTPGRVRRFGMCCDKSSEDFPSPLYVADALINAVCSRLDLEKAYSCAKLAAYEVSDSNITPRVTFDKGREVDTAFREQIALLNKLSVDKKFTVEKFTEREDGEKVYWDLSVRFYDI